MLEPVESVSQVIARKGASSLEWRVLGHWLQAAGVPQGPASWLTDNPADPGAVVRLQGSSCMLLGSEAAVGSALRWLAAAHSERAESGDFHLERVNATVRAAALNARFTDDASERQPYYSAQAWYIEGEPRFAEQVRYPCRMVEGVELLPHFLSAELKADDEAYLRGCLESGPSFICEIGGEAMCWSLTHLGGAMGRIFTPPAVRGRGYARSLTAFQVDDTLRRRGIAVASVSINNPASYRMLQGLGAHHLPQPLTWSRMRWPR